MVQHWLGIKVQVARPDHEHPKRPIQGLDCPRKEISGQRLWGWAKGRFKTPESFFGRFFVINYCPLAFLEQTGRNRTPDRLPVQERRPLFAKCDAALARTIDLFAPKWVLGIGKTAASRAELVSQALEVSVSSVPHPSPASPLANQGWAGLMDNRLKELGCLQD
jgi:single-strand selective monofunctional uracil DNA glycosylase